MKKDKAVMAATLAVAFLAPCVMADVTIYGSLREDVEYDHFGDIGHSLPTGTVSGEARLVDSSSRIGFRGTDKWDNGWSTVWQIENGIGAAANPAPASTNGSNPKQMGGGVWGNRNSFIGFSSPEFGTFRAGNYDSAYKNALTISKLTPMFDDLLDSIDFKGSHGTFSQLSTRLNDSLSWDSAVWSGFQVRADTGLDGTPDSKGHAPIYDVSGLYNNGGFNASLAYQYAKNRTFQQVSGISTADNNGSNTTGGANVAGYQLAASYKFGFGLGLGAGWEHISNNTPTGDSSWNNYVFSGDYWFNPKLQVRGLYSRSNSVLGISGLTGQQGSLSAVYSLSKRTRWYTSIVGLKNGGDISKISADNYTFQNNSKSITAKNDQTSYTALTGVRTDF
ncbi:porin [Silvimonas sp.]|nr:porin [Silvimonas sp.]MDR3426533.1 porin [Silvimonas sp.]